MDREANEPCARAAQSSIVPVGFGALRRACAAHECNANRLVPLSASAVIITILLPF